MYNKNYKEKVTFPHAPKFNTEASSYRDVETCRSSQMYSHLSRRLEKISSVARDGQFTKYKRHICEEGGTILSAMNQLRQHRGG